MAGLTRLTAPGSSGQRPLGDNARTFKVCSPGDQSDGGTQRTGEGEDMVFSEGVAGASGYLDT